MGYTRKYVNSKDRAILDKALDLRPGQSLILTFKTEKEAFRMRHNFYAELNILKAFDIGLAKSISIYYTQKNMEYFLEIKKKKGLDFVGEYVIMGNL